MKKHRRILAAVFLGVVITLTFAPFVWAAEEGAGLDSSTKSFLALAGGFGIAIAASFGAMAQGKAISTGLDGIARNPGASGKIQTPMIIGLAFVESLVIYALVISLILIGKL
jgi:F-type H+-transporting ATPase subunit c